MEMKFPNPIYIFMTSFIDTLICFVPWWRRGETEEGGDRRREKQAEALTALCIMVLSHFGLFSFKNPLIHSAPRINGFSYKCSCHLRVLSVSLLDAYLFWQEKASWKWADQHINSPLMLLKISAAASSLQKTLLRLEQQLLYICSGR